MQFLPEFSWIRTFASLDRTHVGLLQTNDPVLADMGVVVVHHLLLAVHHRYHSKPVPEPAGKQRFMIRDLGRKLSQLFGYQFNISQMLSNCPAAVRSGPFLAFRQFQIGLPGLFCRIRQLMAGMGYVRPENVHCCFQVLPAPVEQVDVCGILDVSGGRRGVQNQLAAVLLPVCFLLLGCVRVCFPFLCRYFGPAFPACAGRLVPILWLI